MYRGTSFDERWYLEIFKTLGDVCWLLWTVKLYNIFISVVTWYSTYYVPIQSPSWLDRSTPRAVLSVWVRSSDVSTVGADLTNSQWQGGKPTHKAAEPLSWMGLDIIVWTCQSWTLHFQVQWVLALEDMGWYLEYSQTYRIFYWLFSISLGGDLDRWSAGYNLLLLLGWLLGFLLTVLYYL